MANSYQLRSQQDVDDSEYAALPGTSSGDLVPHNMNHMKSKATSGKQIPGCHPSRWIYELTNNNFTTCDLFDRAKDANLDSQYGWQHPHRLMINGNQSFAGPSDRVLSALCLDCRFHFVFKMEWDEKFADQLCSKSQAHWPLRDSQFPWHHLVWAGSDPNLNSAHQTKYYPILAREYFACSAPPCSFRFTLEISEPRMPSTWVDLLLDHEAIRETLKIAKELEPARYEAATSDWAYQAPLNLNTYLKNILEVPTADAIRSISKRNKRFAVLFSPRCFAMFRQLEFSETVEDHEGVDEGSFTPKFPDPPTGPSNTTELNTYRAFLEDVRAEIQTIIHSKGGQAAELCTPVLHEILQSNEVSKLDGNALIDIHRYKLLGVLPNQPKEVVVNAYKRQWELMPSKRGKLVEALVGIANDLNDNQLHDYALTQSSVFESQQQGQITSDDDGLLSQALNFLGLQPPNNYSAEALVNAFRQKLAKDPGDAGTARSMLLLIAQASSDEIHRTTLLMETEGNMSLATSKVVLGLVGSTAFGPDTLDAAKKKIESCGNKEAKVTYIDAMEAIANHYNANDLKWTVQELRQQNGIAVSMGPISSCDRPVDYELPVGLENIGNTCYLNSLLQYLFTVKPVRDIALHYDSFKLGLDDEKINKRLLGGNKMQMDRGEAVVAQAFAQELSDLFNNLQTVHKVATRPSQRLANAVLLSTHTLLSDSKPASEPSTSAKPPPLPTRPSPAPPISEDVDMVTVAVNSTSESIETASSVSSRTLVDDSDHHGFEEVERTEEGLNTQVIELGDEVHDERQVSGSPEPTSMVIDLDGADEAPSKDTDINMVDADDEQTVDQKVLNALEHQKRSSGTDQQDVEEVMGSILNRLQAAIEPSSIDEKTGIQLEKIMETFFVTTVNYTKKFEDGTYQQEVSFDRSITAFPAPEGTCSLYDALGRNFDQQIIEESKLSRYTAIKTLPPVLHVLIQRSQSMGSKNGNPVAIPETLYLDRYMDAPHDSPEFRQRVENWMIASRISDIKSLKMAAESKLPTGAFLDDYDQGDIAKMVNGSPTGEANGRTDDAVAEENWDFDGPMDEGFQLINTVGSADASADSAVMVKPTDIQALERSVKEAMDKELLYREEALEKHNSGLKNIPYRLHAVICHRGQLMSGHYWVWIHDFEANVWRKYNDSNVDTNPSTEDVLKTLSTSGEPYFLCYVRDGDKDEYVNVPKRRVPQSAEEVQEGSQEMKDAPEAKLGAGIGGGDGRLVDMERKSVSPIEVEEDELPPYSEQLAN